MREEQRMLPSLTSVTGAPLLWGKAESFLCPRWGLNQVISRSIFQFNHSVILPYLFMTVSPKKAGLRSFVYIWKIWLLDY